MSRRPLRLPSRPPAPANRGGLDLGHPAAPAGRTRRWALAGVVLGALLSGVANLPAAWLAEGLASASQGRVQLTEAQGTLWSGSALPMLTGGPGSRDASLLPSRLSWRLRPLWTGLRLTLQQDCCMPAGVDLELHPGWRSLTLAVLPGADSIGQWPAAWLEGLGAPWNTLKPGGQVRLAARGLNLAWQAGQWTMDGQLELGLLQASSRMSTLDPLGSYLLTLSARPQAAPQLQLRTLEGALQFSGQGEWRAGGLHFRGQAQAQAGQEAALNNLLNIIGRRQGALSVISIG